MLRPIYLLCPLLLVFTACTNDGDFLPRLDGAGVPGDPGGQLIGTWNLSEATTSSESSSTVAGIDVSVSQVGVLADSLSSYRWIISENPNVIRGEGELVISTTTDNNGLAQTIDIPGDVALQAISTYSRDGGRLRVNNPAGDLYDGTIVTLNDSVFTLRLAYDLQVSANGVDANLKVDNTYFFTR